LYQSSDIERFDVGRYIEAICKDLGASFSQCEILVQAEPGIVISADRAISSALIVNELVSNAAKHAYVGDGAGRIWVAVTTTSDGSQFSISVRDEGSGLPEGFEIDKGNGLGARMIRALAEQLNATLAVVARDPGVEFILTAEADGTRLRVIESGIEAVTHDEDGRARYREDHEQGWERHLGEMFDYVASNARGETH